MSNSTSPLKRVNIFGVEIDKYSFEEVTQIIVDHALKKAAPEYVVTPNAHHVVLLQSNDKFRAVYRNAFLSVPDGVPLLWVAKLQNTPLKGRVNGTDLVARLCAEAAKQSLKVFFLGGRPGAAKLAAAKLQQKYCGLQVDYYCPPFGFEKDPVELARIDEVIQAAFPDLLFVGLGAPKQELWIADHYKLLRVPVSLGIGVSFELLAGVVKRAPIWMQQVGLEWLYRLLAEPRRLFKRTIVVNSIFIWLTVKQQFKQRFKLTEVREEIAESN